MATSGGRTFSLRNSASITQSLRGHSSGLWGLHLPLMEVMEAPTQSRFSSALTTSLQQLSFSVGHQDSGAKVATVRKINASALKMPDDLNSSEIEPEPPPNIEKATYRGKAAIDLLFRDAESDRITSNKPSSSCNLVMAPRRLKIISLCGLFGSTPFGNTH